MVEIRKIEVLSLAKINALLWMFLGLILGIGVGLIGFVFGNVLGGITIALLPWKSVWLGIAGFLLMPLLLGTIGFCIGLLVAWFYNLLAWWIGGIRIELEREEES
ncbi:MAG: hypothetical protein ACP5PS_10680 [Bacteroidales bacterium]